MNSLDSISRRTVTRRMRTLILAKLKLVIKVKRIKED